MAVEARYGADAIQQHLALLADAVGELYDWLIAAAEHDGELLDSAFKSLRNEAKSFAARLAALRAAPPREGTDVDDGPQVDEPEGAACPECHHANDHTSGSEQDLTGLRGYCADGDCFCHYETYRYALRLAAIERERDKAQSLVNAAALDAQQAIAARDEAIRQRDALSADYGNLLKEAQRFEVECDAARRSAEGRYSADEIAAAMSFALGVSDPDCDRVVHLLAEVRNRRRGNEPPAAKAPEPPLDAAGETQRTTPGKEPEWHSVFATFPEKGRQIMAKTGRSGEYGPYYCYDPGMVTSMAADGQMVTHWRYADDEPAPAVPQTAECPECYHADPHTSRETDASPQWQFCGADDDCLCTLDVYQTALKWSALLKAREAVIAADLEKLREMIAKVGR